MAIAVLPAADVEGLEMAIMPAHGGLDRLMQVTQRHLARQEEAAPDRWSRAAQRHLQADDTFPALLFGATVLAMIPAPYRSDASPSPSFARPFTRRQAAMKRPAAAARRGSGGWIEGSECRVFGRSRRRT